MIDTPAYLRRAKLGRFQVADLHTWALEASRVLLLLALCGAIVMLFTSCRTIGEWIDHLPMPSPAPTVAPSPLPSPVPTPSPSATPTPSPSAEPSPSPTPLPGYSMADCPQPLAAGAWLEMEVKPHGQGVDATLWVRDDPAFCEAIHHKPGLRSCHLEGWPKAAQCAAALMGGCPIYRYRTPEGIEGRCQNAPGHPIGCHHVDRDDPQTPQYEGANAFCLPQSNEGGPAAGWFVIVSGLGEVQACTPDERVCSNWLEVDH